MRIVLCIKCNLANHDLHLDWTCITSTANKKSSNDLITGRKLFTDVQEWPQQGSFTPSYDKAEPFLIFIDKYVKLAVGGHFIAKWMRMNCNKTLLDKLTASDIAYTLLICENSKGRLG